MPYIKKLDKPENFSSTGIFVQSMQKQLHKMFTMLSVSFSFVSLAAGYQHYGTTCCLCLQGKSHCVGVNLLVYTVSQYPCFYRYSQMLILINSIYILTKMHV